MKNKENALEEENNKKDEIIVKEKNCAWFLNYLIPFSLIIICGILVIVFLVDGNAKKKQKVSSIKIKLYSEDSSKAYQFLRNIYDGLDKYNTEMYIDGNKASFSSSKIFSESGEHLIEYQFNHSLHNCYRMFYGCKDIKEIEFKNIRTNELYTMAGMFEGCSSLETIEGLNYFDTKKVFDMGKMFFDCKNLNDLNLFNFQLNNLTIAYQMFNFNREDDDKTRVNLSVDSINKINDIKNTFLNQTNITVPTTQIVTEKKWNRVLHHSIKDEN